jgi:hypothetical protein
MKLGAKVIIPLLVVIVLGVIGFLSWDSPERGIRAVLSDSQAAVEAKDLNRVMSHVSLQYRDEQGLAYLSMKRLMKMAFDRFEGLDVRLSDIRIDISKDKALVQVDLEVFVVSRNEKAYLIGSQQEPVPIRIALAKESMKWKILSVNGIRLPITEFF